MLGSYFYISLPTPLLLTPPCPSMVILKKHRASNDKFEQKDRLFIVWTISVPCRGTFVNRNKVQAIQTQTQRVNKRVQVVHSKGWTYEWIGMWNSEGKKDGEKAVISVLQPKKKKKQWFLLKRAIPFMPLICCPCISV